MSNLLPILGRRAGRGILDVRFWILGRRVPAVKFAPRSNGPLSPNRESPPAAAHFMYRLDVTLESPAANLALDEALLEWAEAGDGGAEVLRLWEPPRPFVVVGRSSRIELEVDRQACQEDGIPVLRRASGGAAVVTGPGCLMYAVVLSYHHHPQLKAIDQAHSFVLNRIGDALRPTVPNVRCAGTSDLIMADGSADPASGRKFSGNSVRAKRSHLLYHGSILYDFDLALIGRCLRMPPRMPDYREHRSHEEFVTNLPMTSQQLREAMERTWSTSDGLLDWPRQHVAMLVETKYGRSDWNDLL